MKVLFTCGGTAGHVNPAVAVARLFQERHPGCEILFVGADGGMECDLVPREGFEIRTVTITNFQRALSPEGVKHNLVTLRNLAVARGQAGKILDEFPADLVVGTGGYASYPVVREAARRVSTRWAEEAVLGCAALDLRMKSVNGADGEEELKTFLMTLAQEAAR